MQAQLIDNILRLDQVPASATSIRCVLNGLQCYQCNHDGQNTTVDIPIKDGLNTVPAGCRGGSLEVYAIDDQSCIQGTTSVPNFCHASPNRRGETERRLVASVLLKGYDVHRWELPLADATTNHILRFCVRFDVQHQGPTDVLATVHWSLPLGPGWGTLSGTVDVQQSSPDCVFSPLMPAGSTGAVQCEIIAAMNLDQKLPYVIYRDRLDTLDMVTPRREKPLSLLITPAATVGRKIAVLVGVSKYTRRPLKRMSDLEYADDDIVQWWQYLCRMGFQTKVFGDEFSPCPGDMHMNEHTPRKHPQWDGPGTVKNVRAAVRDMVEQAHEPNDRVVFITSSHGSGDGRGSSYLCLLPDPYEAGSVTERQGSYMDFEIASDLSRQQTNRAKTFVFIDACYSGGLIEELLSGLPNVVGTTTCTRKGYGYDDATTHSGAWTNQFLTCCLARRIPENLDLAQVFMQTQAKYVSTHPNAGDRPCFFGRSVSQPLVVNTEDNSRDKMPLGVFMTQDWIAPPPTGK